VIEPCKYRFSHPDRGILELELERPSKQIYTGGVADGSVWSYQGLELEEATALGKLFFFEWQKILFSYTATPGKELAEPVELRINDRIINTSKRQGKVIVLFGLFSFENAVGETKIELRDAHNQLIFRLNTEVFPQKMDYRSDYKAMLAEINQILENLTFDTLKDTFHRCKPRPSTPPPTDNEWWNLLDALFNVLVINLGVIRRLAKHEIRTLEHILPVEKIRHSGKHQASWFRKNARYISSQAKGIQVGQEYFTHAPANKKYVTYDTWENRFVAWALKGLIDKLRTYHKTLADEARDQAAEYAPLFKLIKQHQSRLQGILHDDPFNGVGPFEKRSHFSTSLTRGAGYRDFLQIYLLLSRGLQLAENDIYKIEQKDIATLYEYWCFLKVVQITKELNNYDIIYQNLIQLDVNRVKISLKKGQDSEVVFQKKDTGETTTLYYNKNFNRDKKKVFTFDQKPDYTISFKKEGFEKPFWYLFDAKYRFDENNGGNSSFNVPQDAIGQMHRYRDAILHSQPTHSTYRSATKNLGGVILYPYPLAEEQFKNNIFYQSLKDVNIGALPFLPGKINLVSDFLRDLISKTPESHYEQIIEMDRKDYEEHRSKWNQWVTIDVIKASEQKKRLQFLQEKHLHHIPFVKDQHSRVYVSDYLLLCKSGSKTAFLAKVNAREIVSSQELQASGATWNPHHPKYIRFYLQPDLQELQTPEPIAPISFRYTSLEGLNRYLAGESTKCFYLTSPDAARLYQELKNLKLSFHINWSKNSQDPSEVKFKVGDFSVISSSSLPNLHYKVEKELLHINEVYNKIIK
jgi:uncharacterized protein